MSVGSSQTTATAFPHSKQTCDIFFNLAHDGSTARLFALPGRRDNCCLEVVLLDSDGTVTATCSVPQETPDCFLLDLRSQTGTLVADPLRSGWYVQCVLHHLAKRQEVDLARRRPPPRQPDTAAGLRFDKTQ
jgi:hypothetical protein